MQSISKPLCCTKVQRLFMEYFRLNISPHPHTLNIYILGELNFNIRYVRLCDLAKLFANSGNTDQMPHSAASELDLHCLPSTLFGVSRLKWVNKQKCFINYF